MTIEELRHHIDISITYAYANIDTAKRMIERKPVDFERKLEEHRYTLTVLLLAKEHLIASCAEAEEILSIVEVGGQP
jgi:hypothetical protein